MAMRFEDNESEDEAIVAEINITPLTDVALVLLIIFMISSSAMMESGLQVKLPSAKTTSLTPTKSGKPIYVTIDKNGQISVNDKRADENALLPALREAVAASSDKTVIIRGDEAVVLGKAVKIMDAARGAGADKIALATQSSK
jgi:biopolymer transport protein ExbD